MMEIKHKDYNVDYDSDTGTIAYSGSLRLAEEDYDPLMNLMRQAADAQLPTITLDIRKLRFLNSFGLGILSRFVIQLEERQGSHLVIQGNQDYAWQGKAVRTFARLMPALTVELE